MRERTLVPSAGVEVVNGAWCCAGLDLATDDPAAACELGLVSVDWHWVGRSRRVRLALPGRWRSRPVPRGAMRAAAASVAHNAWGMLPWFGAVAALLLCGLVPDIAALAGVGWGLGLFLLSVLVHEAGHVVAFRVVGGPKAAGFLVSRGMRSHLVRPRLSRRADLTIIVAGPLSPLLAVGVLWPVVFASPVLFVVWCVLALSHALTLLVPVGDGANARDALRTPASAPRPT
ncbi:hypothetical protein GY21_01500 [Cryobacterium roopkundense]|uniref:DUF3267 domain-containing protein n=1 Tax=Cryobacterium roopkundense TaxID=1001240 RepID=A0A099JVS4_9MICO|nr:hypothetical protein [Cryobacterium roopkundense]KGJ81777.1 hypothetical protein GY21_01500 [Cryobacterium roopkundense]MBB5642412.1 hypothetical protein [Cryobacterium roopkundense]